MNPLARAQTDEAADADGVTGYQIQVKVRSTAPPDLVVYRFLAIGYLDDDAPNGQGTAYAAFIRTGDGLALGDLAAWPE